MSGFKKLEIDKYINLNDAVLFKEGKKPIKTKNELAKRLQRHFPQSNHLYRRIVRLETEPFKNRYDKELVRVICETLNCQVEDIMVDVEKPEVTA